MSIAGAPSSALRPAACREQGSAYALSQLPSLPSQSPTLMHGGQPCRSPSLVPWSPAQPAPQQLPGSAQACAWPLQRWYGALRGGNVPAAWSHPLVSGRQAAGKEPPRLFPKLGELSEAGCSRPRTQVSFEKEQADLASHSTGSTGKGLRGHWLLESRQPGLLRGFEMESHLLPKPQPQK